MLLTQVEDCESDEGVFIKTGGFVYFNDLNWQGDGCAIGIDGVSQDDCDMEEFCEMAGVSGNFCC